MQGIPKASCALVIAGLVALPAQATQTVSVNDLGADPTGQLNSTQAFQTAVWHAGRRGVVTCEPGVYRVADVLLFYPRQTWRCPAELVPAHIGAKSLLRVGYWKDRPKPAFLDVHVHTLNGSGLPEIDCLLILDTAFSRFEVMNVTRCGRGVVVEPERHGVWNITLEGMGWCNNGTAVHIARGDGCTEGITLRVNFVAWNGIGLNLPDSGPCSGGLSTVMAGLDFNERDAIIEADNGFYVFSFASWRAGPIGTGLDSSTMYILNQRLWRFGPLVDVEGVQLPDLSGYQVSN